MHNFSSKRSINAATINTNDPMLDVLIFETSQLIEQLEATILSSEKPGCYTQAAINEISCEAKESKKPKIALSDSEFGKY